MARRKTVRVSDRLCCCSHVRQHCWCHLQRPASDLLLCSSNRPNGKSGHVSLSGWREQRQNLSRSSHLYWAAARDRYRISPLGKQFVNWAGGFSLPLREAAERAVNSLVTNIIVPVGPWKRDTNGNALPPPHPATFGNNDLGYSGDVTKLSSRVLMTGANAFAMVLAKHPFTANADAFCTVLAIDLLLYLHAPAFVHQCSSAIP